MRLGSSSHLGPPLAKRHAVALADRVIVLTPTEVSAIGMFTLEPVMNSTSESGRMEYEYHTPSLPLRCH